MWCLTNDMFISFPKLQQPKLRARRRNGASRPASQKWLPLSIASATDCWQESPQSMSSKGALLDRHRKPSCRGQDFNPLLGGTTCLTLLVWCGLVCFLRHYLSCTSNWTCCVTHHPWLLKHVPGKWWQVVLGKWFPLTLQGARRSLRGGRASGSLRELASRLI